jgi:drug/metabolite transporter (DMT)-like permease
VQSSRLSAFLLLAAANLFWSGNWITGRALRDAFDPITLNFWRWTVATLVLAPFALPLMRGKWGEVRRHLGILLLLATTGVALFQSLVYLGLRNTPAINAVLINSSFPMFMLLCSWVMERERASTRQVAGMLVSLAGIIIIITRGDPSTLASFELNAGDGWILLAMPVWGIYSVMLKRRPSSLGDLELLFVVSLVGLLILLPAAGIVSLYRPMQWPTAPQIVGVVYMGVFASVLAYFFWNRGVAVVGANAAGFTVHLLPAFGTVLAIFFLGETFAAFHAVGIATILAGVLLATPPVRS